MGVIQASLANYAEALRHFGIALSLKLKHYNRVEVSLAHTLYNVAAALAALGAHGPASEYFHDALLVYELIITQGHSQSGKPYLLPIKL